MKLLPLIATLSVCGFAALGFVAGSFVSGNDRPVAEPEASLAATPPESATPETSRAEAAQAQTATELSDSHGSVRLEDAIARAAATQEAAKVTAEPSGTRQIASFAPAQRGTAGQPPRPASPAIISTPAGTSAHVVRMAHVTQPVRKASSVSFVVAELAVAVTDAESAARYEIPQNAARLQQAIELAMASAADTAVLRGVSIDSQVLSSTLTEALQADFADVEDVLFLTLYKHDIGYN